MKFLVKTIITAGLTILLSPFLPFWAPAIGILLLNMLIKTGGAGAFFSGFLGMGITWSVYAYMLISGDSALINEKMAQVFMDQSPGIMFLIAGFIGGLTGGISALAGYLFLHTPVKTNMSNNPYH